MIDLLKLQHAETVAKTCGYVSLPVPWIVPREVCAITRPRNANEITVSCHEHTTGLFDGELVGSGEQGFLAIRSQLKAKEKYVTTTPCFRSETKYEPGIREPWFMKVELMVWEPEFPQLALDNVIHVAQMIMGPWARNLEMVPVGANQVDLNLNGIEVGSYGYREHEDFSWVYGTAMAEPRFSFALEKR